MHLIDSHTHIYLPEFDDDREPMMKRAAEAGVGRLLLPAIDSHTHANMLEVETRYPMCSAMIGLHPCSVTAGYETEIAAIRDHLGRRQFIAIGEIGLDFYWDKTFVQQQYAAFEEQISIALAQNLPISIHSRNATDECIDVVKSFPGLRGVFHCFSGSEAQARKIIHLGFCLGIGGVVTFKNSGVDRALGGLDLNAIILETDAPYLAPVPYRGKRNEPAYLQHVALRLSQLYDMPVEEVARITTENCRRLFDV